MTNFTKFKLAAIQAAPVYFDRIASTEKACQLILEAGAKGATLAAFGETWLPGYPFFIYEQYTGSLAVEYLANAVKIPSPTTDQLCEAAHQANIDVVIGVSELDARTEGTVYCTLLFISNEGKILGRHRKLKPTHRERTVWGEGDGSSLVVYERPYGRISGLNCWEHRMILPGYSLIVQGTQVHVASWPGMSNETQEMLSRSLAYKGSAYVIKVGAILSPDHTKGEARKWITGKQADGGFVNYPGESCIIEPWGKVIARAAEGENILIAEGSTENILSSKTWFDAGGHYSRPDIFQVHINRSSHQRIVMTNEPQVTDATTERTETLSDNHELRHLPTANKDVVSPNE